MSLPFHDAPEASTQLSHVSAAPSATTRPSTITPGSAPQSPAAQEAPLLLWTPLTDRRASLPVSHKLPIQPRCTAVHHEESRCDARQ